MNDLIERIESDAPTFHTQGGQPVSFSVSFTVLRRLRQCLKAEMNTLETGCGTTTVVFAASGCHHCCVTLCAEETQKVTAYCKKTGIATDHLQFVVGRSEHVLPRMFDDGPLQFIFIDGDHRFPGAILDFNYTQHRLQVGGILAVDDISIPAVRVLYDFLSVEKEWKRIDIVEDTAFFERVQEFRDGNWQDQRFNRMSARRRLEQFLKRIKGITVRKVLNKIRNKFPV
jgi:predicted O-methyltransferase YrrM